MTQSQLSKLAHTHVRGEGLRNGDYLEERDFEELYMDGFKKALELVCGHLTDPKPVFSIYDNFYHLVSTT